MKFMGHKGRVVEQIVAQVASIAAKTSVICDPCCGSGIVAWTLAQKLNFPVVVGDLQSFSVVRAKSVVARTSPISDSTCLTTWFDKAESRADTILSRMSSLRPNTRRWYDLRSYVLECREILTNELFPILKNIGGLWPITKAYGGFYFSIEQALVLDLLRRTIPSEHRVAPVALAGLIDAASQCAAAPGHTAQPFQPTLSAVRHLIEAWERDPVAIARSACNDIANRYGMKRGRGAVRSCEKMVLGLNPGDVVFFDPPYSSVHYSRFYHVLETIARGREVKVNGSGRYPPPRQRPRSAFSQYSRAKAAIENFISECAARKLRLVMTFPKLVQSNGVSGDMILEWCKTIYDFVELNEMNYQFSSLGGSKNGSVRDARIRQTEYLIACA